MIMFRILFSLACWCHHINLDKICQDCFKKDLSSNRRPCPDRCPQSFFIRWKAVFFPDYRNRSWKGRASIHRRRQPQKHCCLLIWWRQNLRLKTRKQRNRLGLAGVAHPRRIRRSLASPRQAPKCVLFILYSTYHVIEAWLPDICGSHSKAAGIAGHPSLYLPQPSSQINFHS